MVVCPECLKNTFDNNMLAFGGVRHTRKCSNPECKHEELSN